MKSYNRNKLPSWLFKQKQTSHYASSTVSAFDAESGIKSNKGFQARMLAGSDTSEQEKMTVLINNATLRYELADIAIYSAQTINRLLSAEFDIYIISEGEPRLLESTREMSQGDFLDEEQAISLFIQKTQIPIDDIVVLNIEKMQQLLEIYYRREINAGEMILNKDHIPQLIIDQWLSTNTFPEGQGLSPISTTAQMENELGERGMNALYLSDFTFIAHNDNLGPRGIPHDKISTLIWDRDSKPRRGISLPSLKFADLIYNKCRYSLSLIDIISSSTSLEKLHISGKPVGELETTLFNNELHSLLKAAKQAQYITLQSFNITGSHLVSQAIAQSSTTDLSITYSEIDHNEIVSILNNNKNIRTLNLSSNEYYHTGTVIQDFSADHLEKLILGLNDTESCGYILPRLRITKELKLVYSPTCNPNILTESHIPGLNLLDLTESIMEMSDLYAALGLSHNIETLILDDMTVNGFTRSFDTSSGDDSSFDNEKDNEKWYQLRLDKVKILSEKKFLQHPECIPSSILGIILEKMHQLEVLDLSSMHITGGLNFEWKNHSFRHLKELVLKNIVFEETVVLNMIKSADEIRHLDLSIQNKNHVKLLCDPDMELNHVEHLNLAGNTFTSHELATALKKMKKLKVLILTNCKITGKANYDDINCPIVHIDIENAEIEDESFFDLISVLSPIYAMINPAQNKISSDEIIERFSRLDEVIYFKSCRNNRFKVGSAIERLSSAKSITISHPPCMESSNFNNRASVSELMILSVEFSEEDLHRFIVKFPNLKVLTIHHKAIDKKTKLPIINDTLIECIRKSTLIHKHQLIAALAKYPQSTLQKTQQKPTTVARTSQRAHGNTIIGQKVPGVVYDKDPTTMNTPAINLDPKSQKHYQCKPQFMLVYGPDLEIGNTRNQVFFPDFDSDPSTVTIKKIPHVLEPYVIKHYAQEHDSVYRKTPYQTSFNKPIPEMGLMHPWIELIDLTPDDRLLALKTNMNESDYLFSRCKIYDKFFVTLKPGAAKPSHVELEYDLIPDLLPPQKLPQYIEEKRRPFYKEFDSPATDEFKSKPLKEKLNDIYQHPEHHACEARSYSFAYALLNSRNQLTAEQCRVIRSAMHGWIEIKIDGRCHTIDLGGAPSILEFNPLEKSLVSSKSNAEETYIKRPTSQSTAVRGSANPKSTVPEKINSIAALKDFIKNKNKNTNILLICKEDPYRNHIKAVRRLLRSMSPQATMVDNFEQAISSEPYIQIETQQQTWKPVEPKVAGGWMANRLKHDTENHDHLFIDWSSMKNSQSTKLNACIDLKNRQIDGLSIHEDTLVIGLIAGNDARLKDPSFLSRHRGHIYSIKDTADTLTHDMFDLETISIELYHSPQWQKLLLGVLSFDNHGHPVHQLQPLMNVKTSKHIIINNPPEYDEAFERLIRDLEDGREFKYHDQSIKLPPMKVSLTHGYDFSAIQRSLISLNQNICIPMLKHIKIDHVVTPNTFERCLQNRCIKDKKLIIMPGWLASASPEAPLSLYITKTLSEQQYCFLLKSAPPNSLRLYCAPDVVLPTELYDIAHDTSLDHLTIANKHEADQAYIPAKPTIIDVSELTADDLLYRFDYEHDKHHNIFTFSEKVSAVWKKLEQGEDIVLTGTFSNEIMDHLSTLVLPEPYLWHDGQKKSFKGRLILQPNSALVETHEQTQHFNPVHVSTESERKDALLNALKHSPIVFIEGKPGIGKSCFIREMKADESLNCYSYDPYDHSSLKAWAASSDARPTILFIDEATELGTDFTMFNAMKHPKREMLIDLDLYPLTQHHYVVPIGNRKNKMPALLNQTIPTLVFETMTPDYVINTILAPIYAEVDQESSMERAKGHYDAKKSVREMQGEAISLCAQAPFASDTNPTQSESASQTHPPSTNPPSRDTYHLTENRKPIFDAINQSLQARHFMQQAKADSAKYGGQTGHMLEGHPGLGKSDIIHAAMKAQRYEEVTDLNELYTEGQDHRFRYYRIPATCNIHKLTKHLQQAFMQGCIVHIDELDAVLRADTPEKEDDISRLVAELNGYLMGEDKQHRRPLKAGFMLLATGNGIAYHGRAALPESLASRLHMHRVLPYTKEQATYILSKTYPEIENNHRLNEFISKHVLEPKLYTFRDLMADAKKLSEFISLSQQRNASNIALSQGSSTGTATSQQRTSTVNGLINKFNQMSHQKSTSQGGSSSKHNGKFAPQ